MAMLRPAVLYGLGAIVLWYVWMCVNEYEAPGRGGVKLWMIGFERMACWRGKGK